MADDANLGFERQSASYEKFLRGTMSAFNERLQVAEQDRSLRIVTRLIAPGADHDQPRRRHLSGGNCTASRTKKPLLALTDGSAYAQRYVAHRLIIKEKRSMLLFVI